MTRSLILGAGAIGTGYARLLIERGEPVTIATRSGTPVPGAEALQLDASDVDALSRAAETAVRIVVATNPPYHRWRDLWPPVARSVAIAAARSGADVLLMGNLYAYGEGCPMPMTEDQPLRPTEPKAEVRRDVYELLLAASRRDAFRFAEVRASDYFGPGTARGNHLDPAFFEASSAGRTARVVGDPGQQHSWAYLPDIARTIDAAARHGGSWGRAWHAPALAASRTELMERLNAITGGTGRVRPLPGAAIAAAALLIPLVRAARTSLYQFQEPFVSSSSETERLLGVTVTGWDESLRATLDALE